MKVVLKIYIIILLNVKLKELVILDTNIIDVMRLKIIQFYNTITFILNKCLFPKSKFLACTIVWYWFTSFLVRISNIQRLFSIQHQASKFCYKNIVLLIPLLPTSEIKGKLTLQKMLMLILLIYI